VLRHEPGRFPLRDAFDMRETATMRLVAAWTIVGGEPVEAGSVTIPLRPLLPSDYEAGCGGPIEA